MPAMWEDFVCEIGSAPGTGAVTLAGANPDIPCMTFLTAGYHTGDWVYYVITDGAAGGLSEQCMGQFNATAGTLSRATTIKTNTGGTSPLNFTTSVKVFAYPPASRIAYYDNGTNLRPIGSIIIPNGGSYLSKDSVGTDRILLQLAPDNNTNMFVAGGSGKRWRVLTQNGSSELFGVAQEGSISWNVGPLVKQGASGGFGGNVFNIWWPGSGGAHLYIDNTDFGVFSFVSDRRIKQMIADNSAGALVRIMELRPVTYHFADVGLFSDDGLPKTGFIADEVQQVIPAAVNGEPDEMQPDGVTPQPQSLNAIPLIAELTSALQELKAIVDSQAARIAALENA